VQSAVHHQNGSSRQGERDGYAEFNDARALLRTSDGFSLPIHTLLNGSERDA